MRSITRMVAVAVVVSACVSTAQALVMDWVTVGDPGNVDDTHGAGYGGVAATYNIGQYEVTNSQYAKFLNAVAASDPNGLYNVSMGSGFGGITRSGSAGSYTYSPIGGRGNMPVNFVGWYDTLRFANWMHNGQPTGAQDPSTTEDGAYDMSLGSDVVRKSGARVFLPSEDEWYKAAYYKGGGTDAGYWDYPTQGDTSPVAEGVPGTDFVNGSANYNWVVADTIYVGSYTAKPSDSAYGTFDPGGNVWEFNEALIGSYRGLRGGSFINPEGILHAAHRYYYYPTGEDSSVGFRVAAVPGPECTFDGDGDGDVDLDDFALFQAAFTGPLP
ncbi:MAG: formylglycine-generating enzyme family protein [bacterium]|nr:formylglycine-generating enzyme family protein [bacterium]